DDPPPGLLHEPGKVRLLPGAAAAIRRLNDAGWLVVVETNQSGIGRGLYDAAAYGAVQRRLTELLAAHGARVDAAYFCPHYPDADGPCDCRKPGVKLFRDSKDALGIDLQRSYWVGDRLSDVVPARALGAGTAHGLLVATGHGATCSSPPRAPTRNSGSSPPPPGRSSRSISSPRRSTRTPSCSARGSTGRRRTTTRAAGATRGSRCGCRRPATTRSSSPARTSSPPVRFR